MKKTWKIILQIAIVLLVVALIGGGIYWLVTHNGNAQLAAGRFEGDRHLPGGMPGFERGIRPGDGFGFEGRDGRRGANLGLGLMGVGRILLEIGVVTLGVLFIQWLIGRFRKAKTQKPAAAAAAPAASQVVDVTPPVVEEPATPAELEAGIELPGEEPKP